MRRRQNGYFGPPGGRHPVAHPLSGLSAALVLALGGCSSFNPPPANAVDPNVYPANYKGMVMTFLQTNAADIAGAVSAQLSPPALRSFGTESRYVACLNADGTDYRKQNWHKEKMFVFFGGEINQFVDATEEGCKGAAFAPFPELLTMLAQIRSKQK
jgi:hypothetical protein